jgi:nucleotide-binding universal stress UspA family protein
MSLKEILVYVRPDGSDEPMTVAARLAKEHGAYLTGLFALFGVAMLKIIRKQKTGLAKAFIAEEYAKAAVAEKRFREIATKAGIPHDWVTGEGNPVDLLDMFGRLQDLVVLGQTPSSPPHQFDPDVAEPMVLTYGQATLVVPRAGTFPTIGKRIVVAWNGSREAISAVRAARPLIAGADSVIVLAGPSREGVAAVTGLTPPTIPSLDIATHLRHVTKHVDIRDFDASDTRAGPAILEQATRLEADLIVMGAYGRPWLSQWILGGTTRHVLQNMTIPVLMSR